VGFPLTDRRATATVPNVIGAVLTGGSSRRMGRTKALIEVGGVAMGSRVAQALRDAGCSEVLAYGGDADELAPLGLDVRPDRYPATGPLGGVLGLLESLAAEATDAVDALVVVAACDLPSLRGDVLLALIDALRADPAVEVAVARTSQIEPACATWRVSAARRLRELYASGERALHSAIGQLESVEVDVDPAALVNINTPDELGGYP
jgi:molybdopterin-guanine dinucleotide biosynthesis protein A